MNLQSRKDQRLKLIRRIILKNSKKYGIKIERIILFGSRARGDHKKHSDWDILLIIKEKVKQKTLDEFWLQTKRELMDKGITPEIIIVSNQEYLEQKHLTGYIYYWAEKEGITIYHSK